jgi:hypothetical protein
VQFGIRLQPTDNTRIGEFGGAPVFVN